MFFSRKTIVDMYPLDFHALDPQHRRGCSRHKQWSSRRGRSTCARLGTDWRGTNTLPGCNAASLVFCPVILVRTRRIILSRCRGRNIVCMEVETHNAHPQQSWALVLPSFILVIVLRILYYKRYGASVLGSNRWVVESSILVVHEWNALLDLENEICG